MVLLQYVNGLHCLSSAVHLCIATPTPSRCILIVADARGCVTIYDGHDLLNWLPQCLRLRRYLVYCRQQLTEQLVPVAVYKLLTVVETPYGGPRAGLHLTLMREDAPQRDDMLHGVEKFQTDRIAVKSAVTSEIYFYNSLTSLQACKTHLPRKVRNLSSITDTAVPVTIPTIASTKANRNQSTLGEVGSLDVNAPLLATSAKMQTKPTQVAPPTAKIQLRKLHSDRWREYHRESIAPNNIATTTAITGCPTMNASPTHTTEMAANNARRLYRSIDMDP